MYRPPYSRGYSVAQAMFMNEFPGLLDFPTVRPETVVIMGDFNLHLDAITDSYLKQFLQCLQSFGFKHHDKTPTYTSGHILDLIITRKGDKISEVSDPLTDYFISDHCFTSCYVEQSRPP